MTRHHVVVGVDGSLVSMRALDWAAAEAVRRGISLRVLYAVADRDEAPPVLRSAVWRVRQRHPGLPVATAAVESGAARALACASADADVTVVGTAGLGAVAGTALGAVSTRLPGLTQGPLLLVRGDHPYGDGRDVVLGLAEGTGAEVAEYAFQEAERRGARLCVVHAPSRRHATSRASSVAVRGGSQESPGHGARMEEALARRFLTRLRDRHPDVVVRTSTVRSTPAQALVAAGGEAAVVVIGARRRSILPVRRGPVLRRLLRRANCPVTVVPYR
ncbi:universal stress protein [Streptomyces sp. TLI_146]|uniref:universal stress protein n=1 Tax=Streptomyces sp. TLI_146 TaxID=1938858 RepID=UPI000CBE004A|nr:universal stress protein [Streptomyces sp. TLI_146]PKV83137.1 nucleotide-binding universal stress UspA family protein [Streptomyces sp. TLI_146]